MVRIGTVGPIAFDGVVLQVGNTFVKHPNNFGLTSEDVGKQFVAKFDTVTRTKFDTALIIKLVVVVVPSNDELLRNWATKIIEEENGV